MTVANRFTSLGATATGSGSTTAIARPAAVTAGDLLIFTVTVKGTATVTGPTGATLLGSGTNGTVAQIYWYAVIAASETSYGYTSSVALAVFHLVGAYTGATTPTATELSTATALASGTSWTFPAAPSMAAADMYVGCGSYANGARTSTWPVEFTERTDATSGATSSNNSGATADAVGYTTSPTVSVNTNTSGVAQALRLPAAAVAGVTLERVSVNRARFRASGW